MIVHVLSLLLLGINLSFASVLLVGEPSEKQLVTLFEESGIEAKTFWIEHQLEGESEENETLCSELSSKGFQAIIDLSWGNGWDAARLIANDLGMPYLRVQVSNAPFLQAADDFFTERDANDVTLIFQTENELEQGLYHVAGHYNLRVLVISLDEVKRDPYERLRNLRPIPTAFAAFGTAQELSGMISIAGKRQLLSRHGRWTLFVEDFDSQSLNIKGSEVDIVMASMKSSECCQIQGSIQDCICESGIKPKFMVAKQAGKILKTVLNNKSDFPIKTYSCGSGEAQKETANKFLNQVQTEAEKHGYQLNYNQLAFPINMEIKQKSSASNASTQEIGEWKDGKMAFAESFRSSIALPLILRVGMIPSAPWMFFQVDEKTGERKRDNKGQYMYEGYCIDFLEEIAKKVGFEYEIVLTPDNGGHAYGRKLANGSWSGLVGALASGNIDLIVADLTMTSEREETIDYVSPYFDQAGISIILRKKHKEQSLFKFLQVLKLEVWLGILVAVIVTALLLWLLDRFSPYSARNNKGAFPESRVFTLKESIWFALTSLTPQGGGEGPKALSGRVLVAAYWLFVVLMLATFTANLAAFLTVERMQTELSGLEELAKQSRINYTVVKDTVYHEYFKNMADAEEALYQKWKDLSLNGSDNPAKYRVWDYPIREQYTHILRMIEDTGTLESSAAGFAKVREAINGDFAMINDAATVKYEVLNDCNLVEIGEPFAEQPYALAVQQGSPLQEDLGRAILELQKDRYFETLQSKYWNTAKRNNCPVLDDSEGITLQSLGGVFIATFVGLVIAMITLVVEVYMQKKKKNAVDDADQKREYVPQGEVAAGYLNKQLNAMPKVEYS